MIQHPLTLGTDLAPLVKNHNLTKTWLLLYKRTLYRSFRKQNEFIHFFVSLNCWSKTQASGKMQAAPFFSLSNLSAILSKTAILSVNTVMLSNISVNSGSLSLTRVDWAMDLTEPLILDMKPSLCFRYDANSWTRYNSVNKRYTHVDDCCSTRQIFTYALAVRKTFKCSLKDTTGCWEILPRNLFKALHLVSVNCELNRSSIPFTTNFAGRGWNKTYEGLKTAKDIGYQKARCLKINISGNIQLTGIRCVGWSVSSFPLNQIKSWYLLCTQYSLLSKELLVVCKQHSNKWTISLI